MTDGRAPSAGVAGASRRAEALDRLLENVRGGQSAVLVIRGEAGVGKTALLHYCARQASGFRVAADRRRRVRDGAAVRGAAPALRADARPARRAPEPQQAALGVALGLSSGAAPDRFLVALAALSLLAEVAEERPLLCFVDDAQWLDDASAQVLGLRRATAAGRVGGDRVRRPRAERRARAGGPAGAGARGLADEDARALLATVIPGRLDERVRDRIVAETRGNPLALLELPRGVEPRRAGGRVRARRRGCRCRAGSRRASCGGSKRSRSDARRLLLARGGGAGRRPAAACGARPSSSASVRGGGRRRSTSGLLAIGARVRFRHPLVRSAVYRSASPQERQARAPRAGRGDRSREVDPDRRAWHRAQAAPAPDEEVAAELERSAGRAQARGGLAAAAAFLERAATLTPDPARPGAPRCSRRRSAKRDAGALDAALRAARRGRGRAARRAQARPRRAPARTDRIRPAPRRRAPRGCCVGAARRLEPLDAELARETYLEALGRGACGPATWTARRPAEAAEAARAAPPAGRPARARWTSLLDALRAPVDRGHAAAAPALRQALRDACSRSRPARATSVAGCGSPAHGPAPIAPRAVGRRRLARAGRAPGAGRP